MAVVLASKPSNQGFSISNLITRFRSKKGSRSAAAVVKREEQTQQDTRPALIPAPLPLVLPEHQTLLPTHGWTTITFPPAPASQDNTPSSPEAESQNSTPGAHPLQEAYEALFAASQSFFALPASQKTQWKHKLGTEEGWSSIPGEKEFITLRTLEYCPDILRGPAKRYWDLMGAHLDSTLARISTSLDLPTSSSASSTLGTFIGPSATIPATDSAKTATMLRLFRYESWVPKIVAEPHADLGLLSVVVGNVPGLEVWNGSAWFDVEREVCRAGRQGASLLVGRQLERLSNGRYVAGGHRVVSYGLPEPTLASPASDDSEEEKKFRFSIVFVLRAHEPVLIDSDVLETEITGKWAQPVKGVTAGKMYEQIRGAHYNINIGIEEREKQRRKVNSAK